MLPWWCEPWRRPSPVKRNAEGSVEPAWNLNQQQAHLPPHRERGTQGRGLTPSHTPAAALLLPLSRHRLAALAASAVCCRAASEWLCFAALKCESAVSQPFLPACLPASLLFLLFACVLNGAACVALCCLGNPFIFLTIACALWAVVSWWDTWKSPSDS